MLRGASLLARMRYYHRLPSFQALLDAHAGDLAAAIGTLTREVGRRMDPFSVLPPPDQR